MRRSFVITDRQDGNDEVHRLQVTLKKKKKKKKTEVGRQGLLEREHIAQGSLDLYTDLYFYRGFLEDKTVKMMAHYEQQRRLFDGSRRRQVRQHSRPPPQHLFCPQPQQLGPYYGGPAS